MQRTVDKQGEYTFTKEVEVEEGQEYQYKFRVGEGDWWLLNEDQPTVTDDIGNRNNLLKVPIHEKPTEATGTTEKDSSGHTMSTTTQPASDDANKLPVQDASSGYVVRSDTHTPEIASDAAEVADSAMTLDRSTPTPPMPDEEAGRIGYRRMSHTPIPEVADTAAEVADSAAILDQYNMPRIERPVIPATIDFDLPDTPDSGTVTPEEDRVPLFAHECIHPPPGGFETHAPPKPEAVKSKPSIQERAIDFDDPSLEEFPSERHAILEHVRLAQTRLPEDETSVEGIPPSPVVGGRPPPEYMELPSSPLTTVVSPSLDSIPEDGEEGYREELLSALPDGANYNSQPHLTEAGNNEEEPVAEARNPSIDVQEVSQIPPSHQAKFQEIAPSMGAEPVNLPVTPFVYDGSQQLGAPDSPPKEIATPEAGPRIMVQPATPSLSLQTNPVKAIDTAKATAIEKENGRTQVTSRKSATPAPERPLTPSSIRSAGKDAKSRDFLKAFWRVVFVEWIGGFIMRLCGGDRQKA